MPGVGHRELWRFSSWRGGKFRALFKGDARSQDTWPQAVGQDRARGMAGGMANQTERSDIMQHSDCYIRTLGISGPVLEEGDSKMN